MGLGGSGRPSAAAHLRGRAANSRRLAKDYDEAGQRPVSDKLPAWSADGRDGADAPDGAEGRHVSLATMPPGPRQRRVAWAVVIVSALAFVAAVPFVRLPLAKIPAFIPSYESALAINDLITAVLLFGAFARLRSRGLEKHVVYVRDNGIGIAEEFHENIFRVFKRLNAEDDDKKGTGVGLSFVRKIVERHGGRIWLGSSPGKGATFYFTIEQGPRYEAAA
jgi:hypothetical protein